MMEDLDQQGELEDPPLHENPRINGTSLGVGSALSLLQRIALRLLGSVYVGHHKKPGWRGPLPFYAFRCPRHGMVVSYPCGYDGRLDCPLCLREEAAQRGR